MSFSPTHELTAGDSLSQIAWDSYQEFSAWREIADANGLDIFAQLPIGTTIDLPTPSEVASTLSTQVITIVDDLDLSTIKQPETGAPYQLVSWII